MAVSAELDGRLSRWLWLVKWILVIPHWIVLFFLWIAFFVVTVIAFFAILFLVKWWLLAIPHYLVLAFFSSGMHAGWWSGGLITLLTLIAAFALAFTDRYPRDLFALIVGLNRWVLRVAAYASLMTDAYPPFRLDQGGTETAGTEHAADGS
ncbi:DUF4389 domain-containing protein [Streptomyces gardneri]|uniref:Membrane protein n=1 Tax=Streptomyces gardneri TaxID=66892 RepID=A0A4Y3RC14_9ACTN|nr:DUF4389 domain-containing protein [Streptomyces gardneri]GEB55286.1 membrane protein [Streptomyces gardneri]GHG95966.1 membrane protein [Streptomyces gardneri]